MYKDCRRREYIERCTTNLLTIRQLVDNIQADLREVSNHTQLHDRFFAQAYPVLKRSSSSDDIPDEELVDLYMDTCAYISQLMRALEALQQVKRLTHMYDYSSNPKFEEIARQMLKEA